MKKKVVVTTVRLFAALSALMLTLCAGLLLAPPVCTLAGADGNMPQAAELHRVSMNAKRQLRKQTMLDAYNAGKEQALVRREWDNFSSLTLEQVMQLAYYRNCYNAGYSEELKAREGVTYGPSGKETYYNLNMSGVIERLRLMGIEGEYSVREDGVKMYGDYIMCAADFSLRPIGTIVETSLGEAIVCDTGYFIYEDPYQIDIAVTW